MNAPSNLVVKALSLAVVCVCLENCKDKHHVKYEGGKEGLEARLWDGGRHSSKSPTAAAQPLWYNIERDVCDQLGTCTDAGMREFSTRGTESRYFPAPSKISYNSLSSFDFPSLFPKLRQLTQELILAPGGWMEAGWIER